MIQPTEDKFVRLVFDDVWLQKCSESSIVIKDLQSQKVLATLCKYPTTPYVVLSEIGKGIQVEFKSSTFYSGNKGFTARYNTISQRKYIHFVTVWKQAKYYEACSLYSSVLFHLVWLP